MNFWMKKSRSEKGEKNIFCEKDTGNSLQSEHRDKFDPSPPPICFHSLFKDKIGARFAERKSMNIFKIKFEMIKGNLIIYVDGILRNEYLEN